MKIPVWMLSIVATALLALQGWTLTTLFNLSTEVASLRAEVHMITGKQLTSNQGMRNE